MGCISRDRLFESNGVVGVCNLCPKEIKLNKHKSTSNVWRHLKQKHRGELEIYMKEKVNQTCKSTNDVISGDNEVNADDRV